jgi:membrane protein YqaA with SNARE-associated domain
MAIQTLRNMRPGALASFAAKTGSLHWWISLGAPSLILIGLLDNSAIPLPGSMDVLTVVLAAHHHEPWIFYAILATLGAVLGGYITYNMARKTGKEALEKRFAKRKVDKVYATFEKWGFAAVAIPALLPPPFPIVPMLLAAGALQYPTKKFLAALSVGRGVRYSILAFLGAHYGRHVVSFFTRYYKPTLIVLIAFSAIGGLFGLYAYLRHRKPRKSPAKKQSPRPAEVGRTV